MQKLRVVHIIPSLAKGGAERLVLDICRALQQRNDIEVKLVVFRDEDAYPQLSSTVDVTIIPSRFVPSLRGKAINETAALRTFLQVFKPDVIHTHLFEAEIVTRATAYYNAAYVCHCHYNTVQFKSVSIHTLTNKTALTDFFERRLVMRYTRRAKSNIYVAISSDTQRYFETNLPTGLKGRVKLLHNAIDYNRFAQSPLPAAPAGELKLINVGSFNKRKNQQFLVHVANLLKQQGINVHLTLLGDGAEHANVKKLVKEVGATGFITLPGNVENVEERLAQSHLYLHSATYEPFGLVLVEAMAAGLPVIALDGKGNRDLHKEGITGYLVETENKEVFASKVTALLNDKALYAQYSASARAFASHFDIQVYTDTLVAIYQNVVKTVQ